MTCRKCGREVPQSAGPGRGRPRSYCSTGCRRAMEYELRRLQKALETVEQQLRWCRMGRHGRRASQASRYEASQVSRYEAERVRLEDRLRELLGDRVGE